MAQAQTVDSVDVLDYDVSLDLSHGNTFNGDATLTVRLTAPCATLKLDLHGTADSVWVDGVQLATPTVASIPTAGHAVGDTLTVRVAYHCTGYVESYGFGGFHFDSDMSYNLGVGFVEDPHVMGRVMMPCRDNFHDKATYTLRVKSQSGWTAECSGELRDHMVDSDGCEHSVWRIGQPVCTYLVGVSQAAWNRLERNVASLYGTYPLTLGYTTQNATLVERAFAELDSVVPMFERCFGPYRWGRIGYIATTRGSMEHVTNIALAKSAMTSTAEQAQMTIAHELAHAWFGNLVTCATGEDMWINEGGASFCSEVAMESTSGRKASDKYYQANLESVVRTAHLIDEGYRALSPMPHAQTYGSTTYDKGALVWHSLRGLFGDSLFYNALQRLMTNKAFDNIDAYALRDSLSLYTGVDLTDFFQFHVFTPGFVDYHVELTATDHPAVNIKVQGVGTYATPHSGLVPVTFFGTDGSQMEAWFEVDSNGGGGTLDVMYDVAYCVLDNNCALSDAATLASFDIAQKGTYSNNTAHVKVLVNNNMPEGSRIAVEHHWGRPWNLEGQTGVVRSAQRYWMVRGTQSLFTDVQGRFRFVHDNNSSSSYAYLDPGFIVSNESIDSLVLLYRPNSGEAWQAVSHERTGSLNEGFLCATPLRTGEYTLAIVDPNLVGIITPTQATGTTLSLFPNPVAQGEALTLKVPVDGSFTVRIFDAAGHPVWQKKCCHNGRKISPCLASGIYMVQIENRFVSLQSKLIVL